MGLSVNWTIPYNVLDARYATTTYVDDEIATAIGALPDPNAIMAAHLATGNPHSINKTMLGLDNVTNHAQLKASQLSGTVDSNPAKVPSNLAVENAIAAAIASLDPGLDPIVAALVFGGS